jgi:hypothetical protein
MEKGPGTLSQSIAARLREREEGISEKRLRLAGPRERSHVSYGKP